MPVIRSLDGQVDEVIIKPISGRRREDERPPKGEETPEPSGPPERAPFQTPPGNESSANADELPVWLL